jgi:hypothetical protein
MKAFAAVAFIAISLLPLGGCESQASKDAKLAAAIKESDDTGKRILADLQWKLDDATAEGLFRTDADGGVKRYLAFRKCHEEPPTHDANKKVCADLQKRVANKEKRDGMQQAKEKAAW